jgi:hypothetical protein
LYSEGTSESAPCEWQARPYIKMTNVEIPLLNPELPCPSIDTSSLALIEILPELPRPSVAVEIRPPLLINRFLAAIAILPE